MNHKTEVTEIEVEGAVYKITASGNVNPTTRYYSHSAEGLIKLGEKISGVGGERLRAESSHTINLGDDTMITINDSDRDGFPEFSLHFVGSEVFSRYITAVNLKKFSDRLSDVVQKLSK